MPFPLSEHQAIYDLIDATVFLAVLDAQHRALLRLDQVRGATQATAAEAEAARAEAGR
jgi:hypothetical protein